jgi:transposase-like protein
MTLIIKEMNVQEQIVKLFESLSSEERASVMAELQIINDANSDQHKVSPVEACPYCSSKFLIKNGHRGVTQRYKCNTCQKTFSSISGSCYHAIKKVSKFEQYSQLMFDQYLPIAKMAEKIGISVQTSFDWRHKILSGLNAESKEFKGITEIDDVWFLYSQKGRKGLNYSRGRGGSKRKGDNKFQVKLLITADRQTTKDFSVTKIGRISKSDLDRKVGGKFDKSCTLVSDKHRSISAFAKSEKIPHVNFKASEHTAGGEFHVQTVNNLASRVKAIVNHQFRGVSTKYLQSYSNWFAMNEKLKSEENRNLKLEKEMEQNKKAWGTYTNIESSYKVFIETQSERTYRCPTIRNWSSAIQNKDLLGTNSYL